MTVKDLSFEMFVNCEFESSDNTYTSFISMFKSEWKGLTITWKTSGVAGETPENWIEFKKSHSSDPTKAKELGQPEGAYYYPFRTTVASKIDVPTQLDYDKQLAFLREIQKTLEGKGCLTVVSSSFEHLL